MTSRMMVRDVFLPSCMCVRGSACVRLVVWLATIMSPKQFGKRNLRFANMWRLSDLGVDPYSCGANRVDPSAARQRGSHDCMDGDARLHRGLW